MDKKMGSVEGGGRGVRWRANEGKGSTGTEAYVCVDVGSACAGIGSCDVA